MKRIAIAYTVCYEIGYGSPEDRLSEEENEKTVIAITEGLEKKGYDARRLPVGRNIFEVIDFLTEFKPDVVMNLCDTIYGRSLLEPDFPGLLELLSIKYTGATPSALFLCKDKWHTKSVLKNNGIRTPRGWLFRKGGGRVRINKYPVIMKPIYEDGSVGIDLSSFITDEDALKPRLEKMLKDYCQPVLAEEYIEGREIYINMIGRGRVEFMPFTEIDYSGVSARYPKIISFEAKWVKGHDMYEGTKSFVQHDIPEEIKRKLRRIGRKVFELFSLCDYARVDTRVTPDGKIYVLDVNPNPDIAPDAGFAKSGKGAGLDHPDLVEKIIRFSLE